MPETSPSAQSRFSWGRAKSVAKFLWGATVFPFFQKTHGWKKTGIFLALWGVVHPAAVTLFPDGETFLKQEGLDPRLAQELAPGMRVHVRRDDFAGKMHALFSHSPLMAPYNYYRYLRAGSSVAAFAGSTFNIAGFPLGADCSVYVKSNIRGGDMDALLADIIEESTKGLRTYRPLITPQELRQQIILHEFRHCSAANRRAGETVQQRENDADLHALRALSRQPGENRATLRRRFMMDQAQSQWGGTHDSTLVLDADLNGTPAPDAAQLAAANKAMKENARELMAFQSLVVRMGCITCAPPRNVRNYPEEWGRRRLTLYWNSLMESYPLRDPAAAAAAVKHQARKPAA